jgi:hypothetical protein
MILAHVQVLKEDFERDSSEMSTGHMKRRKLNIKNVYDNSRAYNIVWFVGT